MTSDIAEHSDGTAPEPDWLDEEFSVVGFSRAELRERLGLSEAELRQLDDFVMYRIAERVEDYFKETTFWEALEVYARRELELAAQRSRLTTRQPSVQATVLGLLEGLRTFRDTQSWLLIPDGQAARNLISLEGEVAVLLLEGRLNDEPDLPERVQAAYRQGVVDGLVDPDAVATAYTHTLSDLKVPANASVWAEDDFRYNHQLELHLTDQDVGMMAWLLLHHHVQQWIAQIYPKQATTLNGHG